MSPRFTLHLSLIDNHTGERLQIARDLDHETIRISSRAVDDLKVGADLGVALMTMDQAVTMMKRREFRKKLFTTACQTLGTLLAERMEDAEGWHDQSRIEPAREQLGGTWR